jgi:hypothetical protein
VVPGLVGQVAEQVPEPTVGQAHPAVLTVEPEQHLCHGQAHQLGVGQHRAATPSAAGRRHMIVDLHIQCGQESLQVSRHRKSWTPSSHAISVQHADDIHGIDHLGGPMPGLLGSPRLGDRRIDLERE